MFFKKSLQMAFLLIASLFLKGRDEGKTYTYDEGEVNILNGHVKQILSFYERHIGVHVVDTANFDPKGNQIEVLTGNPWDRHKEKYFNTYDKNGRVIETTSVSSGSRGVYTYFKQGYSIRVMYHPSEPSSEYNLFIYNKAGYLIERDHYFKPKLLFDISKYMYDKNHRLIEIAQRSKRGQIELLETFKYLQFDSENNWTKMEVLSKGFYSTPVDVQIHESIRKIFYY